MEDNSTTVTIDGKVYTLVLDLKVMRAAERLFSTPLRTVTTVDALTLIERGSITHLSGLVLVMLQRRHPELTQDDVDDLAQRYGGIFRFTKPILDLANQLIPDQKDLEDLGVPATANPPRAQAQKKNRGTGGRSTFAHAGRD